MKELKYVVDYNIKKQRQKYQITQMDLAEKADLLLHTIKSIELARRGMTLDGFLGLAKAFEVCSSVLVNNVPYIERFQK